VTLFGAWVLFPGLLALLAWGCGLLLERAAGTALPGGALLPAGMATIIVLAQVPIVLDLPGLTTPVIVLAAAAGLYLARDRRLRMPGRWLLGAALMLFAVYAAPIVLSGEATFAGYIKLDDTSTWLGLTDQVMERGLDLSGLASSTYEATIDLNLGAGYPFGVFLPLGIGHELTSIDVAWLIQPYMATLAVALMLALWSLLGEAIERPWMRAAVCFVAAQPALLFGYYLWGGIKEMAAAALLATGVALLAPALRGRVGPRAMLAPACAIAALAAVLTPAGVVWLAPVLALAAFLVWKRPRAGLAPKAVGLALAVVVLSLPVLTTGTLLPAVSDPLTAAGALGNLIAPLNVFQIAGVWPVGDFRLAPHDSFVTTVLIALVVGAALWGVVEVVRRRNVPPALYAVGIVAGSLALFAAGSPWNGGKALAAGSPAVLLAAGIGIASLARGGRRFEAAAIGGVILVGVLWSNILAYRAVWLAPRAQLVELEQIGEKIAGQGPTLMTEYQPYGVRHFLRKADPEGASELRRRQIPLATGGTLEKGEFADTDRLALNGLLVYRTLVLRRSPSQSRPPLPYALRMQGDFYEVWQRPAIAPGQLGVIEHMGLGSGLDPGGVPSCGAITAMAERAPPGTHLVAPISPPLRFVALGEQPRPSGWTAAPGDPRLVTPTSAGTLTARLRSPRGGEYEFWVGGSISAGLDLKLNGESIADVRRLLNNSGQYMSLGQGTLRPGANTVELEHSEGGWAPGVEVPQAPIGPLVLRPVAGAERILSVVPAQSSELCGRRLDWVELVEG
jgi:hypothetical protein